jgi:hypothetical protein
MNSGMLLLPNFNYRHPSLPFDVASLNVSEEYAPFVSVLCVYCFQAQYLGVNKAKFPSSKVLLLSIFFPTI